MESGDIEISGYNIMIRGRWIWDSARGELVDAETYVRSPPKRSDLPAPGLIMDTMAPVQSMLDGKMYDSKSHLRKTYRQAGVLEVGNDPARHKPFERPKPDRRAIRTSIQKAKAKVERGEFTERTKRKLV